MSGGGRNSCVKTLEIERMWGKGQVGLCADQSHVPQGNILNNIQALRFYAAFAVVLYHSRKIFTELGCQGDGFLYWAQFGNAGVDVFFVISGYVMWHTTCGSARTVAASAEFLRRRLFRIYLGYWPFYFLAAAVILVLAERNLDNIYWVKSFLLFNPTIRHQVLGVAWTLSYELYFYIMFSRLLLLFCGVMIVVMTSYAVTLPRMHMNRIQGFGVAAMFVVLAAVLLENRRWYIASRLWVFLGNCSYSIYLGHFILIWIYMYTIRQLDLEVGLVGGYLVYFSYLAVVIGLSAVSYQYLEAPLYKYALRNWFSGLSGARRSAVR